jgi:hypothetical protein
VTKAEPQTGGIEIPKRWYPDDSPSDTQIFLRASTPNEIIFEDLNTDWCIKKGWYRDAHKKQIEACGGKMDIWWWKGHSCFWCVTGKGNVVHWYFCFGAKQGENATWDKLYEEVVQRGLPV